MQIAINRDKEIKTNLLKLWKYTYLSKLYKCRLKYREKKFKLSHLVKKLFHLWNYKMRYNRNQSNRIYVYLKVYYKSFLILILRKWKYFIMQQKYVKQWIIKINNVQKRNKKQIYKQFYVKKYFKLWKKKKQNRMKLRRAFQLIFAVAKCRYDLYKNKQKRLIIIE